MTEEQQDVLEYIEFQFGIILTDYQKQYIIHLMKNPGAGNSKSELYAKYLEFKGQYPDGKVETSTKFIKGIPANNSPIRGQNSKIEMYDDNFVLPKEWWDDKV